MNIFKIVFCVFFTLSITATGYAMNELKEESCIEFSAIEQQLILREVQKRGKDCVLHEINKKRIQEPMQWNEERQVYYRKIPMALKIKEVFYKTNREQDSLTKNIFDVIEEIENGEVSDPQALLGLSIDYNWIKDDNENDGLAVQIKSYFKARSYIQKSLEKVINSYNQ